MGRKPSTAEHEKYTENSECDEDRLDGTGAPPQIKTEMIIDSDTDY